MPDIYLAGQSVRFRAKGGAILHGRIAHVGITPQGRTEYKIKVANPRATLPGLEIDYFVLHANVLGEHHA